MMGDNRDNSSDSRIRDGVGYVPFEIWSAAPNHLLFRRLRRAQGIPAVDAMDMATRHSLVAVL
jgi:hypothetical protein